MTGRARLMEPADFPFAVSVTDTEHWGFTTADFGRCLAISPDGCFVIEEDGRRAGILTTVTYGDLAWMGNIIIAPALRGRGLGAAMIAFALEHLDARGVRGVRLWAYPNTVALYEKFGFVREDLQSVRMLGFAQSAGAGDRPLPDGCQVYPSTALNWRDALAFDRERFGSDRSRVLEVVATGPDHPGFIARAPGGAVAGFVFATRSPKGCEVGPWVVDPDHAAWAAPALIDRVLDSLAGDSVELGAYREQAAATDLLHDRGFHAGFVTERMTRGPAGLAAEHVPSIFAIGSLERG